jgi:hypothetical protein
MHINAQFAAYGFYTSQYIDPTKRQCISIDNTDTLQVIQIGIMHQENTSNKIINRGTRLKQ